VDSSDPNRVVGDGTAASCTSAAVVAAVAAGGVIDFSCGPNPIVITMAATAKVGNAVTRVVLDGGGKVTLSGGGRLFFVSNDRTGSLSIQGSTLRSNPSAGFSTAGYPGIFYLGVGKPSVSGSTLQ